MPDPIKSKTNPDGSTVYCQTGRRDAPAATLAVAGPPAPPWPDDGHGGRPTVATPGTARAGLAAVWPGRARATRSGSGRRR